MENLENVSMSDAGRSSLHNNKVTRERALGKYFKPSNIDLGDNTKTDYTYKAPTEDQLARLEKANQLRLKKERKVLMAFAAVLLFAVVIVFVWMV